MKDKNQIQSELEQLSPFLAKLRREQLGGGQEEVPQGYFDTIADRTLERAQKEKKSTLRAIRPSKNTSVYRLGRIAAAVAVFVIAAGGLWFVGQNDGGAVSLADLEQEEAIAYVTSNITEFEFSLLEEADLLDEQSIEDLEVFPGEEDVPLEDYLEGIDYDDLEALF